MRCSGASGERDEARVGSVRVGDGEKEVCDPPMPTRRWWWVAALGLLVVAASGVGFAYAERVGPQFPLVAGAPYQIEIGQDGCPVVPDTVKFVDSPGQFVAPDPSEVDLCTRVDNDGDGVPDPPGTVTLGVRVPPLRRTLHGQAAIQFAALLNQLPDRNGAWRDWQRRHSGLWPDAPWDDGSWDADANCIGNLLLPVESFTYVLHYQYRAAVAIVGSCHGWTDGTRTRVPITYTPPHLTDTFIALYDSQP